MDKKEYRCLYNHELLILFTSQTPYQSYRDNVTAAQVRGYVDELAGTDVDALMCCPTAWRTNLWPSRVDPHWRDEAPCETEPLPECDWKYYHKAYYRARRYMLAGNDPVRDTLMAARRNNLAFFISYRMNDHHYVTDADCPTHNRFWREHPGYWLSPGGDMLNYSFDEVREHYFRILEELCADYDVDGLELDFQRSPRFFPPEEVEKGRDIMTAFVERIHAMKEGIAAARGKSISLCVRVPHTPALCEKAGLDVPAWDAMGLIDMVNISPYFKNTLEIDIEGFRKIIGKARLYGEMHFITVPGVLPSGFSNNINRRTSRVQYQSTAFNYLCRGADGLSFFNFAYTRDHYFNEPRTPKHYCVEPPFDVLRGICDRDALAKLPRHYALTEGYGSLPRTDEARVRLAVYDDIAGGFFRRAVLRVESRQPSLDIDMEVSVNGVGLAGCLFNGELSEPLSEMALPRRDTLRHFEVPLTALKTGENVIHIRNAAARHNHRMEITGVELGLYR